ncbi:hypothetical protein PR202_ga08629 [Eleusine coracana subsp. coracana]|uniref:Homeobox-DDT domain protein RLT3 n=1 Tax=Eleusine coracana subsp. coracana TaxID=191504 RepID=A0AAV5C0H0_ELECO|nr:hypothetical protein PR202_ga08629 [Eleusine coracana subsp. coracana]
MLEKFYTEVQYPKPGDMVQYATSVGLTYNQVRIWFKERRRKERKEMETIGAHMERQLSSRACGPSNTSPCNQAPLSESSSISTIGEEPTVWPQVLFPKDYILRKIFRKEGPPLGSEFDPLPQRAHGNITDAPSHHSSQNRRAVNKRKIMESTSQKSTVPCEDTAPVRKHGMGKGLMTVWHAMYSHNVECQGGSSFIDETGCLRSLRPFDDCDGFGGQDNGKRIQVKPQVPHSRIIAPREHSTMECHLSVDNSESSELQIKHVALVDDEELELSELQAGPNPLQCSAHLSSSGRHGCPLCKDLLSKFPPQSVKMKQPFSMKPWDSSPDMVKKLFQIVRFVYSHFDSIDVHPFTFDEFVQAFHDKDSFLLGEVHVGLLKLLFSKSERGCDHVFVPRSSTDCRFFSFLNFIVDLNILDTLELEQLIYLTLSSDITLFEKIASTAYRLRVDPCIKGKEDATSESENSGSVDDEEDASSSDESYGSQKMNLLEHDESTVARRKKQKIVHESPNKCSEIDESYPGERWLLGLMEGEYSDLSIDEKLDCLVALIDVVSGAGSVPRLEEPQKVSRNASKAQPHPSGGKIKKSTKDIFQSSDGSLNRPESQRRLHAVGIGRHDLSGVAHEPQVVLLGSDRRYNSYWLFLGPCRVDDPGHRRVYFESSEDGHWEVVDSPQELLSLLSILDSRGTREAHLLASLEKRQACLFEAMKKHLEDRNAVGLAVSSDSCRSETSGGDGDSPKRNSIEGDSPVSEINAFGPTDLNDSSLDLSSAIAIESGKSGDDKILMWERLQVFDKWIWTYFYSTLTAVKCGKKSFKESLVHCGSCHDLYWRDEKHCRICHSTFEVGFDLEERYAVHVATCREPEVVHGVRNHKVLPSQLQALKASIYAIEASMPDVAFVGSWKKSAHKLWVKRLRRTSSLPELLQVLVDFVGAMNEDWLYKSSSSLILQNIGHQKSKHEQLPG